MDFKKIDIEKWDRKENYTWFTTKSRCKINMTMNVDVTKLIEIIKKNKLRYYPTFTYITSKVLNSNDEFKMNYDDEGNLGIYDVIILDIRYSIKVIKEFQYYGQNIQIILKYFTIDLLMILIPMVKSEVWPPKDNTHQIVSI